MIKYVFGFLCVWYSVSVFSKTEILFEKAASIEGAVFSGYEIPLFLLHWRENEID